MPSELPSAIITPWASLDRCVLAFAVVHDCSYAKAAITLIVSALGDEFEQPATRARIRASLAADAEQPREIKRRIRLPATLKSYVSDEALIFRVARAAMLNALLHEGLYQVMQPEQHGAEAVG